MKEKILVILDNSYSYETFEIIKQKFNEIYGDSYIINVKLFEPNIKNNISNVQSLIDEETKLICEDNYICVIAYGLSAHFLMQSFYNDHLIVINPILINKKNMIRNYRSDNKVICILSHEYKHLELKYDNIFFNSTVVLSDKHIHDIQFWNIDSEFGLVLKYIIKC